MEVQHDQKEKDGMFFIEDSGKKVAMMTYSLHNGKMVIEHTLVDESLRGKDIGVKLVNAAVKFGRDKGMKIISKCSYAKKVLERGEEYKDVLA